MKMKRILTAASAAILTGQKAQTQVAAQDQEQEHDEFYKTVVAAGKRRADHQAHAQKQTGIYRQFMTLPKQVTGAKQYGAAGKDGKTQIQTGIKHAVAQQPAGDQDQQ